MAVTSSAAGAVAQKTCGVAEDVVAAGAVEVVERERRLRRGTSFAREREWLCSRPYYGRGRRSITARVSASRRAGLSLGKLASDRAGAARGGRRRLDRLAGDRDQAAQVARRSTAGASARSTSPSGRMIAPRRRASSVTRWPMRSAGSCSPRSMPTMKPRRRTSATSGIALDLARAAPEQRDLRLQARRASAPARRCRGWRGRRRRRAGCRCRCGRGRRSLLLGGAEEGLVDALGGERRRERQVAAGQALGEAEQVGRDALLLAGEHRAGAAEAGRDLVADQQHAVRVAELAHGAQVAGRVDEHPGGALDERLDDHRGDLLLVRGEDRARGRPASPGSAAWAVEQQRPVGRSGRGRCRRPRPSRSCRRGRRRGGRRTRSVRACWPPRCCRYWKAIFSAISTAVEPESE